MREREREDTSLRCQDFVLKTQQYIITRNFAPPIRKMDEMKLFNYAEPIPTSKIAIYDPMNDMKLINAS